MRAPIRIIPVFLLATGMFSLGCGGEMQDSGAPIINVEPSTLNFEQTRAGRDLTKQVTIKSVGENDLRILGVEFTSTDETMLHLYEPELPEFPVELQKMREQKITIRYAPTVSGASPSGVLTIKSNDPRNSQATVQVVTEPTQAVLIVQPTNLIWGETPLSSASGCSDPMLSKQLELSNVGNDRLSITGWSLEGLGETQNPDPHFSVCPSSSDTVSQNISAFWKVAFHPQSLGVKRAKLTISSSGGNAEVFLEGGGSGLGGIAVSPTMLLYSNVIVGARSDHTLSITNTGNLPVNVTSLAFSPATLSEVFFIDRESIPQLAEGQSQNVMVSFIPNSTAPMSGELLITHDAEGTDSPVSVLLYGNSALPGLQYDPPIVRFTGVEPGESQAYTVVISNSGSADLEISKLEVGPTSDAVGWENFSIDPDDFTPTIESQTGRATFEVIYTNPPQGTGRDLGCLNIYHNDPTQTSPACLTLFTDSTGTNLPPVAIINVDPGDTVQVGEQVTFDGSESYDPDGNNIQTYAWRLTSWPPSSSATLDSTAGPSVTFTPDQPGPYEVSLVVTDDSSAQFNSPEARIQISALQN